jgi:hypothetical protein
MRDEDNTAFEPTAPSSVDAQPGFARDDPDAAASAEAGQGDERRSPRPEEEIPQEPLAARVETAAGVSWRRRDRQEG